MRIPLAFAVALALAVPLQAGPSDVVWFLVSLPPHPVRNQPVNMLVIAQNSSYQQVPGYTGTVHFTADDSSVELPADYTFTSADGGMHYFTVTFHRGYWHQVWVTDINSGAGGSVEALVDCPDITLTASNSGPICPGSTVTLTATTNAASPSWNWHAAHGAAGAPTYDTQTAVAPDLATWEVYMSDAETGCFASAQTQVEHEPPPEISVPSSATGDFMASIANDPNGPYANIQWIVGNGTIIAGAGSSTITVRPDSGATRVSIGVTATRVSTNCTRSETDLYVTIDPGLPPVEITTPLAVCPNATDVTASVLSSGPYVTYTWIVKNGSLVGGQGTRTITYNAGASGSVTLLVTGQRSDGYGMGNSVDVTIDSPSAVVSGGGPACPGTVPTVVATFSGIPPFNATWSDGFVQNAIDTFTVTRVADPNVPLSITHFADATACEGRSNGEARFVIVDPTAILKEPADRALMAGESATLSVTATGENLSFQWFEGKTDDRSRPVGVGNTFDSPPIHQTKQYWVLVRGTCGEVSSRTAELSVIPRRRPMGR